MPRYTRGASIKTVYAKQMRRNPTPSEAKLWELLRRDRLGYRFHRQRALYGYIVDFYCPKLKLLVEVDGDSHDGNGDYDRKRDKHLAAWGYYTLRIPDDVVMDLPDFAISLIQEAVAELEPSV